MKHYENEYMRGGVTTKTVEGAFNIFKRGMRGVYQHCAEKRLRPYWPSLSFATATAKQSALMIARRSLEALKGISGKRLS